MKRNMNKTLSSQELESICAILGDTYNGFTKSELKQFLANCNIAEVDDGSRNSGLTYTIGLNKKDWLYNCFAEKINTSKSCDCVFLFVETALNPISYTSQDKREKYNYITEELNKVLLLIGLMVDSSGKIIDAPKANSLSEVDERVNHLQKKLYDRAIHYEVMKYCSSDFLRKDFFDAVFEASKGLAQRVRDITGLGTDGCSLFNTAFALNDPFLFFNSLKTDSERNEHNGLKELLSAIFHLVRNPEAHTPKINWKIDETKALDILTLISFAHKYLDECHKMPNK